MSPISGTTEDISAGSTQNAGTAQPQPRRNVHVAHTPDPESLPEFLQAPTGRPADVPTTPHALLRAVVTRQWPLILTKAQADTVAAIIDESLLAMGKADATLVAK